MAETQHWTAQAIDWCFRFLFAVTPLLLFPSSYELFEFNKMIFVYFIAVAIGLFWLLEIVGTGSFRWRKSAFSLPILGYLAVTALTTIISIDPHTSIFGYYSRFNGGLLSIISYTLLFFAYTTHCGTLASVKKHCQILLASSAAVSGFALLERLGIDKNYWVQDVQARVFSTFGQPNWLAAFLAMVLPLQLAFLLLATTTKTKIIHLAGFLLNYLAFTFTYSRGGTLGLVAGLAVFGAGLFASGLIKRKILLGVAAVAILSFLFFGNALLRESQFKGLINAHFPVQTKPSTGSQLDQPGTESSQIRLIVWQGAWQIFLHHPLLGTGNETFAYAYYQYRPVAHNMTSEWDFLYNKAHNEYLNELATKGIIGFASYIFLIGSFFAVALTSFVRLNRSQALKIKPKNKISDQSRINDLPQKLFILALTAGYLSYLIQNIFGFSVVMIALLFFLFPAFLTIITTQPSFGQVTIPSFRITPIRFASYCVIGLIGFYCITFIARMWIADLFYAKGYAQGLNGYASNAYETIYQAVSTNPNEPLFQSQLGYIASQLVEPALEQQDNQLAKQLQTDALGFTQNALAVSPRNIQFLRNAAKTYTELSLINPTYLKKALATSQTIVAFSPTDPQDRIRLAQLLAISGNDNEANKQFIAAVSLKPDYKESRITYATFLAKQAGVSTDPGATDSSQVAGTSIDPDKLHAAIDQLRYYLTHVDANDLEVAQQIASLSAKLP